MGTEAPEGGDIFILMADSHCWWQKSTHHCKAIILQLKSQNKTEKSILNKTWYLFFKKEHRNWGNRSFGEEREGRWKEFQGGQSGRREIWIQGHSGWCWTTRALRVWSAPAWVQTKAPIPKTSQCLYWGVWSLLRTSSTFPEQCLAHTQSQII